MPPRCKCCKEKDSIDSNWPMLCFHQRWYHADSDRLKLEQRLQTGTSGLQRQRLAGNPGQARTATTHTVFVIYYDVL